MHKNKPACCSHIYTNGDVASMSRVAEIPPGLTPKQQKTLLKFGRVEDMAKRSDPLYISLDFETTVKALLPPPPPAVTAGSRKGKPKSWKREATRKR